MKSFTTSWTIENGTNDDIRLTLIASYRESLNKSKIVVVPLLLVVWNVAKKKLSKVMTLNFWFCLFFVNTAELHFVLSRCFGRSNQIKKII